jgi:hypothetical protein
MKKHLSNKEIFSVEQLGAFFRYLDSHSRSSILINAMKGDYLRLLDKENKKIQMQLSKEVRELIRETFSPSQRIECELLMQIPSGNSKAIEVILERGRILTGEEYEMLLSYVQEKAGALEFQDSLIEANKILADFGVKR